MLTACLFTVPFFVIWSFVNSTAWSVGSTQALPATTIILLMLIWLFIGFPLTVVGGIMGKNRPGQYAMCKAAAVAKSYPLFECSLVASCFYSASHPSVMFP